MQYSNDELKNEAIEHCLNTIKQCEQQLKNLLPAQNRVTISMTDRRLLKLQLIAASVDTDLETLLYIALEDYENKVAKFDATNNNKSVFKI